MVAIEVKASATVTGSDFAALQALRDHEFKSLSSVASKEVTVDQFDERKILWTNHQRP